MTGNEVLDAGKPRGGDDLLVGRVRLSERDVVADLAEEQIGVLQHEADAGAQIGRVVLARIDVVDDDLAVRGLVEARNQTPDRGLAGSDAADDADAFAAGDLEGHLLKRGVVGAGIFE